MPKGGRTNLKGPGPGSDSLSAGYASFIYSNPSTTSMSLAFTMPYQGRVMEVMAITTGGTSPTYSVVNTTQSANIIASRTLPTTVEVITPTSATALANRDFAKGDVITIANGGTLGSSTLIVMTVKVEGHVVASPAND